MQTRRNQNKAKRGQQKHSQPKHQRGPSVTHMTYSCSLCDVIDTDDMVACDLCDSWFHFTCVGVTREIEDHDWVCHKCRPPKNLVDSKSASRSVKSTGSSNKQKLLALQRLEEDKCLREKRESDYLRQKYHILELSDNDSGEDEIKQSSLENTLRWAKEVQNMGRNFDQVIIEDDNISISVTEDERTMMQVNRTNLPSSFVPDMAINTAQNIQQPMLINSTNAPINNQVQSNLGNGGYNFMSAPVSNPLYSNFGFQSTPMPIQKDNISRFGIQSSNDVQKDLLGQPVPNVATFQQQFRHSHPNVGGNFGDQLSGLNYGQKVPNVSNVKQPKLDQFAVGTTNSRAFQELQLNYDQFNRNNQKPQKSSGCFGSNVPIGNSSQPNFGNNGSNVPIGNSSQPNFGHFGSNVPVINPGQSGFGKNDSNVPIGNSSQPNIGNFGYNSVNMQRNFPPQVNFGLQSTHVPYFSNLQPNNYSQFGFQSAVPMYQPSQNNYGPFGGQSFQSYPMHSNFQQSFGQASINYDDLCKDEVVLTPGQLASRHTMEKRLPRFFGEPTKWQLFESAFVNATKSCGLSNSENLPRLLDCLKGDALDAVKCRLLHPSSVPGVMNTLRMMYGKPELIIHKLLEDIKKADPPNNDDLGTLVKFAIAVQNLCSTVKSYNAVEHLRNPILMKALTDKLPTQIRLNWACFKNGVVDVNLSTLGDWLFNLATIASDVVTQPVAESSSSKKARKEYENQASSDSKTYVNAARADDKSNKYKTSTVSPKVAKNCPACSKDSCRSLSSCAKFKELNRQERWNIIKNNNKCGSCLGNHRYSRCKHKKKCGIEGCVYYHHTLLHNDDFIAKKTVKENLEDRNSDVKKTCNSHNSISTNTKLSEIFRIVPVILYCNEKSVLIYAYLDDGSNLTTLEQSVIKQLGVVGVDDSLCVLWSFGDNQFEQDSERVSVEISGVFDNAPKYMLNDVRTVKKLYLPTQSITVGWIESFSYFKDIPITPYLNAKPQMIIGLQYSKLMVSLKTIEGNWSQPIVCKTRLGWVVQGPNDVKVQNNSKGLSMNMCECESADNNLQQMVKGFFQQEDYDVKISEKFLESKKITRAQHILESTTAKIGNRYETGLLWRSDKIELPDSYSMAKRRLECVESRMKKDPVLATKMCNYIKDFLDKGYIHKLDVSEQNYKNSRIWYLPIFPVFNPKKPDKFRVVWDGAAKVNGVSLNSMLLTGPDLLTPLPDILRRFRERKYGIGTDITEMYHRIFVIKQDRDSQRFLWRDGDNSKEPDIYSMDVLCFGSACSPSSAQFVKKKNAEKFKDEFPKAVDAIVKSHYVDDMLDSTHTEEGAIKLVKDVQFIYDNAGFELRNFTSNSKNVLQAINGSPRFINKVLDDNFSFEIERVLGMYWNTENDTFTYRLKFVKINDLSNGYCPTKREVLRTVMSVFDPLGFLVHFLIYAKILLQEIWRQNIGWDERLPISLKNKWMDWINVLPKVETIQIPRLYSPRMSPEPAKSIQLHVFVDASLEAYASVAYFRIENESGVDSCLVGAKSKVAPIRPMSVPRLELQGAVLGTRLAGSILKSHFGLTINKTIIWCDSQTVLFWLNSDLRRYTQFVAFRVGEILESSEHYEWRWIPSEFNVADEATKSSNTPNLDSNSRWFTGPEFLRDKNSNWTFDLDEPDFYTEEELRSYYLLTHLEIPVPKFINYERFSNWNRLLRSMAYVLRFTQNCKSEFPERSFDVLSKDELFDAEQRLYKQAQFDCFKEEILVIRWNEKSPLEKQKEFDKSSIIRAASPYLDEHGVMRVKGRIDAAVAVSDSAKRPIILDRNHYITYLIVYWYHRKYLHLHHQTVLNEVKQKFWIPKLRVLLNNIRSNCQKCKNAASIPRNPEMAPLPYARLAAFTRPYTYTGVDYFGPIKVIVNRGTQKRWGVLFTCMTTRAIHLEIAHSLNTSSCIMAVNNFMNSCGTPREIFSDNGTNFHGSDNTLQEEFKKLDKAEIEEKFTTSELLWTFNPPTAAHMGGVWERMVRTVKTCLDEVMTVRYPTDEVLTSLFKEVEMIINSRPLTYVSLDSVDDEVITPNHFLFLSSNGSKPLIKTTKEDLLRNTWKTAQAMADQFWQKFVLEYLPTLTQRSKWFKKTNPIKVGDVVIIVDENFKRNTWLKGIVVETFMDKTGQVRRARVRTATGTIFMRPVSNLAILDVKKEEVKLIPPESVNGGKDVV